MVTIKLEGFKELDAVLGTLTKATARGVMRRALLEAAEPMAALARRLAPDDPNTQIFSRDLRESIVVSTKTTASDAGKQAFAAALRSGASRGDAVAALRSARREGAMVNAYVGPTPSGWHGGFQEFGTINHPPQPFLRPAFIQDHRALIERLRVDLADQINQAVARAARKAAKAAG